MSVPLGPRWPRLAQQAAWILRPARLLEHCQARYGDTFTLRFPGTGPLVFHSTPAAVRDIFTAPPEAALGGRAAAPMAAVLGSASPFVLDGPAHEAQRRWIVPALRPAADASALVAELADRAIDRWPIGQRFAIVPAVKELMLAIIVNTIFGLDADDRLTAQLGELSARGTDPFMLVPLLRRELAGFGPWARVLQLRREVDRGLNAEIAKRDGADDRRDALSLLVRARDEGGHRMPVEALRDALVSLLVAGHETSAVAIGWALSHLLRHPAALARAKRGEAGYVEAVVHETLRLTPVIPWVGRSLAEPLMVEGRVLPAGATAFACIYLLHRRAERFARPECFEPMRFVGAALDPFEYVPFGGGAHRCLGFRLAVPQITVVLERILARTELELDASHRGRSVRRVMMLVPEGGVPVVCRSRVPTPC